MPSSESFPALLHLMLHHFYLPVLWTFHLYRLYLFLSLIKTKLSFSFTLYPLTLSPQFPYLFLHLTSSEYFSIIIASNFLLHNHPVTADGILLLSCHHMLQLMTEVFGSVSDQLLVQFSLNHSPFELLIWCYHWCCKLTYWTLTVF